MMTKMSEEKRPDKTGDATHETTVQEKQTTDFRSLDNLKLW